jgi:hypothetical protein
MSIKPVQNIQKKQPKVNHPGMMGDGTEEQNLNEDGDPSLRIKKQEVDAAFSNKVPDGNKTR